MKPLARSGRSLLRFSAVALAPLLVVTCAGCGSGGTPASAPGDTAATSPATGAPAATPTAGMSPSTPPVATPVTGTPATKALATRVYFLRGEKVVAAYRRVPVEDSAVAAATVRALLAGPTSDERAAGVSTAIPDGTQLRGIAIAAGTARVDLTGRYEAGGGSLSMSARLMQVVFTLTQFPSVQRVEFRLDGTPVRVFGGEGIMLDHPATRAQYESFLPPIFIESPAMGEPVTSPVTVRGLANVFEGQFSIEVTDRAGRVLATAPGHAAMGEYVPFTTTLTFAAPTPGPGRVTGFDESAKDGTRILDYTVPVTLQ